MMCRTLLALLITLFPVLTAQAQTAQQSATVLRDTELRAEPFSDAAVVVRLKSRSTLTILQRRGGWYQARDRHKRSGWVRMSTVRFAAGGTPAKSDDGISRTLNFLSTGRSGASGVTVATGIRGLDSADVVNAKPDHDALKQLERYKVNAAQARSFALNARLRSQRINYVEEAR